MNCIRKKGRKKRKNRLSASCDFGGRTPSLSPSPLYKDRLDKREGKARYCHSVSRRSSWDQYPFRTFSCDSQRDSSPCETGENSFLSFARSPFFPRVVFLSFSSLSLDEASRKAWRSSNDDILKGSSRACTHHRDSRTDLSGKSFERAFPKASRETSLREFDARLDESSRLFFLPPFYSTIRIYETVGNGTALRGLLRFLLDFITECSREFFFKFES